nr:sugar ABC transporter permease [Candidatus Dormibacteraeota bacterium]
WGLGNTMVIYFAALRQVPNELYEAARVDGAKPWAQFFRITVPMISGTLFYTLVINTIFALQYFTEVYTMFFRGQESGVSEDALFYVIYLFRQSFEYFHMGYASAMAWLLFAIIVVVTLVQVGFSRKFVHYEGEA